MQDVGILIERANLVPKNGVICTSFRNQLMNNSGITNCSSVLSLHICGVGCAYRTLSYIKEMVAASYHIDVLFLRHSVIETR